VRKSFNHRPSNNNAMFGVVWVYLFALQSWSQLEAALPATTAPVFFGSLPAAGAEGGDDVMNVQGKPVLYRDAAGLSVAAQQVWLALEIKEVDYVTVLVSVDEEQQVPSSTSSTSMSAVVPSILPVVASIPIPDVPIPDPTSTSTTMPMPSMPVVIQWPDGTKQTNVMEILERIQKDYADKSPDLYKRVSVAVDNVRCNMQRFDPVFPRNTDPTLYAPYMFRKGGGGEVTSRDSHMVTLEGMYYYSGGHDDIESQELSA
jgi:hypothetical protein